MIIDLLQTHFHFLGKIPPIRCHKGQGSLSRNCETTIQNSNEEIVAKCDGLITRVSARKRLLETLDNLTDTSDTIVSSRVLSTYLSEKDMAVALVTSTVQRGWSLETSIACNTFLTLFLGNRCCCKQSCMPTGLIIIISCSYQALIICFSVSCACIKGKIQQLIYRNFKTVHHNNRITHGSTLIISMKIVLHISCV